jgi:hypothetical protein
MLALGFAHAPLAASPQADASPTLAWLASTLPNGVVICGGAGDAHHVSHGGDCAACHLTAAPGLPLSPGFVLRAPSCIASLAPPGEPARPILRRIARANSRGPPSI